ncbi:hypothetical protein AVEN_48428-1 [Araneus ventricosus]|uniref:Uncharacterized protein n=1 Tax=Araneus ventricosus TaxID=182803 RepID=A0A4Y2RLZ1_ARAVE|nr:hypothetical protein AVEN_48428-1 [Araneus ventricosus]
MEDRIHSYFGPFVIRQHRVGFEFSPPSYVLEGSRNLTVVIANGAEFLKFLKRFLMDSVGFEDISHCAVGAAIDDEAELCEVFRTVVV